MPGKNATGVSLLNISDIITYIFTPLEANPDRST